MTASSLSSSSAHTARVTIPQTRGEELQGVLESLGQAVLLEPFHVLELECYFLGGGRVVGPGLGVFASCKSTHTISIFYTHTHTSSPSLPERVVGIGLEFEPVSESCRRPAFGMV